MRYSYRIEGRPGHRRKATPTGRIVWERVLTPNARVHYMPRHEVKQHDQASVMVATRGNLPAAPLQAATVHVTLHWGGNRRRDPDNTTGLLKGVMDGLVSAGVLADDSFDVVQRLSVSIVPLQPGESDYYHVIVEAEA